MTKVTIYSQKLYGETYRSTDWMGIMEIMEAWCNEAPKRRTWDTTKDDTIVYGEYSNKFGVSIGGVDYDERIDGWPVEGIDHMIPDSIEIEEVEA